MNFMHQKLEHHSARDLQPIPRFEDRILHPGHWNQCYNLTCSNRTGHWSEKENAKYFAFLKRFQDKFNEKESRRHWKVFKSLAQFIKTRDPNQCRSHHHKMKKNFSTIEETLQFLKSKQPGLQKRSQKYLKELQDVDFNDFGRTSIEVAKNSMPQHPLKFDEKFKWDMDIPFELGMNQSNGFGYYDQEKKHDIAYKKTNEGYLINQELQKNQEPISEFNNIQDEYIPIFNNFPATNMLNSHQNKDNNSFLNNDNQINTALRVNFEKNRLKAAQFDEAKAQKVMQCQYYFNKWMNSLEILIQGDAEKKRQHNWQ